MAGLVKHDDDRNYIKHTRKVESNIRMIGDAGGLPARGPSAHRDAAQLPAGRRPKEDAQLQTQ